MTGPRKSSRRGQRAVLAAPYLWIAVFFLAPMALIAKISLSHPAEARPPYEPMFSIDDGLAGVFAKARTLSFDAYRALADDRLYLDSYLTSLLIAGVSTAITLMIAYPFALAMARAPRRWRPLLIGLAVAPFWTSFLDPRLRLDRAVEGRRPHQSCADGAAYHRRAALDVRDQRRGRHRHCLLLSALHAAAALFGAGAAGPRAARGGGRPWRVAVAGVLARHAALVAAGRDRRRLLVFIPAVGEFVIPDLLGGSDTLMIGRTLWNDFFANRDWPAASAAAIILLALLIGPLLVAERARLRAEEQPS